MGSRSRKENSGSRPIALPSRKVRVIAAIVLAAIIAIGAGAWYVIDLNSYVATVAGKRITTTEYTFFLTQQRQQVEYQEGISDKTDAEKKTWWTTKTAEGEDPFLVAKNDALDSAKEYEIQLLKAAELGLSVNQDIKDLVQTNIVDTYKSYLGEDGYASYVKENYGVDEKSFIDIAQNLTLISNFKTKYIADNFTTPTYTDDELKAYYDENQDNYLTAGVRWIYFSKTVTAEDGTSTDLSADEIAAKKAKAEDLLAQLLDGADMVELVKANSEDTARDTDEGLKSINKAVYSSYSEFKPIVDFAFSAATNDVQLIETTSGFYVTRLESVTTFDESKTDVTNAMVQNAQTEFYTAALDGWMADAQYNLIRRSFVLDRFKVE